MITKPHIQCYVSYSFQRPNRVLLRTADARCHRTAEVSSVSHEPGLPLPSFGGHPLSHLLPVLLLLHSSIFLGPPGATAIGI